MGVISPALSQEFYAGKTMNLIVGNPAGSGYDAYARLLARHIVRHIPGKPTMIVQNMPGAGGIRAADYLTNVAQKDGMSIALVVPGAIVDPLSGDASKYRYDPTKLGYIGTMDSGTRLCMTAPDHKVKSLDDARNAKVNVGTTGPGSSSYNYPLFMNALFDTKFNLILGYQGPPDIFTAIERGEIDAACTYDISTFRALRPHWLTGEGGKKGNPIMQLGLEVNPAATALGYPSVWEFVKPEDKPLVELIVSQQVFQRPYIAPPGMPPQALAVLQKAFMESMKDPELIADAAKSKLELNPKSGEEVSALVQKIYASPKPLIERMFKVTMQP